MQKDRRKGAHTYRHLFCGQHIGLFTAAAAVLAARPRFLGNLLNIKPILHIMNGRVEAVGKVRTMRKAVEILLDKVSGCIQGKKPVTLTALYANEPERAENLLELSLQHFSAEATIEINETFCHHISPVIGAHTGPDGVGLAYLAGM